MGKIKFAVAMLAAKFAIFLLKITKHNGTNYPGTVALRICPDFLKYVNKPQQIIAVTGTNGKTTTSNMLKDLLAADGKEVLNNSLGSNINTGIATSLIRSVSLFNKEKYDTAVLEIDERSANRIFPYIHPQYMVVTNFSRDSIMRNAHPEYIRDWVAKYLPADTKLILNADDLIASSLAPENPRVYYGIAKQPGDGTECKNLISDMQICPRCNTKLKYDYIRYSNIGRAYCPDCGFTSPAYDVSAETIDTETMRMTLRDASGEIEAKVMHPGIFNIYNQVACTAMLRELGYSLSRIAELMEQVNIVGSRLGGTQVGSRNIIHMFCKGINAYAESRIFEHLETLPGDKELVFVTNSVHEIFRWSENVSWLYDADFELLKDDRIKHYILFGRRGYDYKLRLLLAGIPEDRITLVDYPDQMAAQLKLFPNDNIYVLYGADAIKYAKGVYREAVRLCQEKMQEEAVPAIEEAKA